MKALLAGLMGLALAGAATAQTPPAQDDTTVEEVVVTAPQREMIEAFVEDVSAPTSDDQLGRWDRKICPGVTGLKPRFANFLNDRIARAAYQVGLDVGEPGCRPNIMIVITNDGNRVARELFEKNPKWVDKWGDANSRGRRALREFVETPRPVRWWHVSQTVTSDGKAVSRGDEVEVRGGGRISRNTRQDFARTAVIVDMTQAKGAPLGAIADYVAMVALAQLDPKADTRRYPTILNLFADRAAGREAAGGLTSWDKSYLAGLYDAKRDARSARSQGRDITRRMQRRGK